MPKHSEQKVVVSDRSQVNTVTQVVRFGVPTILIIAVVAIAIVQVVGYDLKALLRILFEEPEPKQSTEVFTPTSSILWATETPVITTTSTPIHQSPATPIYQPELGLITYYHRGEKGISLYTLAPDGTPIPLIQEVGDARILSISPDQSYLAIAVNQKEGILALPPYGRYVYGNGLSLLVVSADGQVSNTIITGASQINAIYLANSQLLIATQESTTITYTVALSDGSNQRLLYRSDNVLPETAATAPP